MLFAAGRGQRLRPLSDRLPKPVVPILDVPLGAFALAALLRAAAPVVVNLSHLPAVAQERLIRLFGESREVEVMVESPEAYGTGGTLKALEERIYQRVVTCNSDLLCELDPADLLRTHLALGTPATAAVAPVEREADLSLDPSGERARGFVDRRRRGDASGGRFLGMAVFERRALELIPKTRPVGVAETALANLAERAELGVYLHRGYAEDVGTLDRYLKASLDVLDGTGPEPPIDLPGRVVATEGGPVYVGPAASGPVDALGPGAILLQGSRVSKQARLANSIVWPGEEVPPGAVLEDSIWAFGRAIDARRPQRPKRRRS